MKKLLKSILIILAIFLLTMTAFAVPDGSESDPWQIDSKADLESIGTGSYSMAHYYIQTADIDLGGSNFKPIGYVSGPGYTAFTGHFDGKGYKIYNGSIGITKDYIGIFAYNKGTIQNVRAKNIAVSGQSNVAVLAGYNYKGTIQNCYSTGSVEGQDFVGGLVGYSYRGTIQNCYSTGSVEGQDYVGGLVGYSYSGGTIQNCYSTGSVDGIKYVGGLVGRNYASTIQNCYSTGIPTGTSYVGGLVGNTSGGTDTENYWDTTTSETATSAMGTGKTTAQMKDIDTFVGNWDMVDEADYVDEDWFIDDGNDYPKLGWEYGEDKIDIGMEAIKRNLYAGLGTRINSGNPANASGKITSVEIYARNNLQDCEVATFYETDTNKLSTRDYESIGTVTAGSKQTFTVDLDVKTGDYLGIYYSDGDIEIDGSGDGYWYKSGQDHIPCTEQAFIFQSDRTMSLYGTGTTLDDETPNIFFIFSNF